MASKNQQRFHCGFPDRYNVSISSRIVSSSGTIISGEKTRSISGGSYEIKKLSEDKIGKNAFKHVNNKVTIKCPEKVLSVYMEFLPKKGVPKKATFE